MGCAGVVLTRLAGAEVAQGRTGAAQGLCRGCAGAVQKLRKSCAGAGAAQVLCRGGADAPGCCAGAAQRLRRGGADVPVKWVCRWAGAGQGRC